MVILGNFYSTPGFLQSSVEIFGRKLFSIDDYRFLLLRSTIREMTTTSWKNWWFICYVLPYLPTFSLVLLQITYYIYSPRKVQKKNAICLKLFCYKGSVHWKLKSLNFLINSVVTLLHSRKLGLTLVMQMSYLFANYNSTRSQVDEEPLCGCATLKSLFIYLFVRKALNFAVYT